MATYEYAVLPAPERIRRVKGAKGTAERFAHALAEVMNGMAREGWDYVRAETLPCEEGGWLSGRRRSEQSVLVFRRARPERRSAPAERAAPRPESPEAIAAAAAAALHPERPPARRLGPAGQDPAPARPRHPLGPAAGTGPGWNQQD
jgi:hypothetical protein